MYVCMYVCVCMCVCMCVRECVRANPILDVVNIYNVITDFKNQSARFVYVLFYTIVQLDIT